MKLFAILLLVLLVCTASAQDSNIGDLIHGFVKTATSNVQASNTEGSGNCMSLAIDLATFVYTELQALLQTGEPLNQMALMMKGMVVMTKFNAAKEVCFPSTE
mmetsp:Transcript_8046/g.9175  ORF Transcript_8046/g.9175 Transcript_8046/m.9175 type:complete len:103 (+) Transcript_8046:29-337(+)|eukprot:CAMPEP_0205820636 /NCGR_PEP_ID=MMETSP0206-20130828/3301_1 /ASSEMBLY_ACC=CAM_ASM_000279 /TAXON_ID=36767 /ORGANISM="Euplotes focardii, Strain TN1" /LENGTH=102 /DNA_ID=CAMNT_0053115543 /DNA_START=49 /DNA_END=357 /DNA_ORIENTATION=+